MNHRWVTRTGITSIAVFISALSASCSASRIDQESSAHPVERKPPDKVDQQSASSHNGLRAEIAANPAGDVAQIHRLWSSYLASRKISYGCEPSVHWASSEQGMVTMAGVQLQRCYDFTDNLIWPRDQRHEVLAIEPVRGAKNEYRITARFTRDSSHATTGWKKTIVDVYAIREGDQWKLSGALPRVTASWQKERIGPFTYHIAPGIRFSRSRADSAVAFADSLARAFDVPRLEPVDYYVVESGDAMVKLYGVNLDTLYGTAGGQSLPGIIVSGDPVFAENHGHEIAHTVLFPLYYGKMLHVVASEGVVTWLGGTRSMRYPEALRALRQFLIDNPSATMDTVLAGNSHPLHNHGAALLSAMVHERADLSGIRRFLDTGETMNEFRPRVEEIMRTSWEEIASDWKRRALAAR